MKILFVGDIFGSAGRRIVREHIGHVREAHNVELVIINAENAAGGFGVTPQIAEELFDMVWRYISAISTVGGFILRFFTFANGACRRLAPSGNRT